MRGQGVHIAELRLGPDEGAEGDVDFLPVEIFGEVEEMRFEQFLGRIEAWADADVRRALEDASVRQAAGDRVNAVMRAQIIAHVDVCGREAEQAAVLVAMFDRAAHGEGAGKQARGGVAVALAQRVADAARRDDLLGIVDRGDHFGEEAVGARMVGQRHDIAAAALAEDEVAAGDDPRRAVAIEQQPGDEILGRRPRERRVEGQDEHRVGARRGEQFLPLIERCQAKGRDVGLEEAHRMRVEGRDDRGAALVTRMADGTADDRLMPGVEAVEIAERDHPATQRVVDTGVAVEANHGAGGARGTRPADSTRIALPPIAARISSSLKPASISACVTCTSFDVSKRTVVAPS